MTSDIAPTRRRWAHRIRLGIVVALFAWLGYGAWRQRDVRKAGEEAKALGWDWVHERGFGGGWQTGFGAASGFAAARHLYIENPDTLKGKADLVRRLAPRS